MLYFIVNEDRSVRSTSDHDERRDARDLNLNVVHRQDFENFEQAKSIAKRATDTMGELHIACDGGSGVWPRYDVIKPPKVGDKVSYAFNGDSYLDGEVVRVGTGKKMVIVTSTGNRYYRRHQSGSWVKQGGTWNLVQGHQRKYNRER